MKSIKTGFAMPAIMIVGTVLFFILAYGLNVVSSTRGTITASHNQMLARQAAESGISYARSCIMQNNRIVTWTEDRPLRPNTDCRGDLIPDYTDAKGNLIKAPSPYLLETDSYRTYFEITPSDIGDEYKNVSALGKMDLLNKASGETKVALTLDFKMLAYISTSVTFDDVVFGSLYVGNGYNDLYSRTGQTSGFSKAVYFFTKTHLGNISSVGYNMDGVLTGYKDNVVIPWNQRLTSDPREYYHTPYSLAMPSGFRPKKIITDFQGNGWITFFLGYDGRTIYGTGSNINCDLGIGYCTGGTGNDQYSRPPWLTGKAKMDMSNIPANEKVVDVLYNSSTFLLTDAGKVYTAGTSSMSPGMGSSISSSAKVNKPTQVRDSGGSSSTAFHNQKVKLLYTDSYYTTSTGSIMVAVTEQGNLFAWGQGSSSSISTITNVPKIVLSTSNVAGKVVDAVTDGATIWALDDKGRVWSGGNNKYGQLGRGLNSVRESTFGQVSIPGNETVVKIAADAFSVLFLTTGGNVYGAGLNDVAQLGFPANTEICRIARSSGWNTTYDEVPCSKTARLYQIPTGKIAQDIFIVSPGIKRDTSGGSAHEKEANDYRNSFVITTEGEVYGAGSNRHGQLGLGDACQGEAGYDVNPASYSTPQKMNLDNKYNESGVPGDEEKVARARVVRSGIGTTIIITDENHVFTVGNNASGQLGSGDTRECHVPKRHRFTNVFKTWYY